VNVFVWKAKIDFVFSLSLTLSEAWVMFLSYKFRSYSRKESVKVPEELLRKIDSLKDDLDQHRPLRGTILQQLKDYYRIGSTYSSNALEGNTLTESETKVVIEEGITIGGKPLRDHLEAIGHAQAYDHIYLLLEKKISEEDVLHLHKQFFSGIDAENAGQYRKTNVIITGTDYLPPDYHKVPALMKRHMANINKRPNNQHPLIRAADLHSEFESIHPFVDGNGRIGRLLLSLMTIRHGYCPVIIPPVRRAEYIQAIKRANKKDLEPLRKLIESVVYEEMRSLKRILAKLKA
jgi:Fic family protein